MAEKCRHHMRVRKEIAALEEARISGKPVEVIESLKASVLDLYRESKSGDPQCMAWVTKDTRMKMLKALGVRI